LKAIFADLCCLVQYRPMMWYYSRKAGPRMVYPSILAFPPISAKSAEMDGARIVLVRAAEGIRVVLASTKSVAIFGK
jgi:hypothetical protein